MTARTGSGLGIMARLKAATRAEHDAIEAVLDLMGAGLTPVRYRHTLERFYGYYRPLEDGIRAVGGWPDRGLDLDERSQSPHLRADLTALGATELEMLPVCRELPCLDTPAACFGCLYVLEGATLGGQHVSRHVRAVLGVTPETGGRFFHGYGERTGAMWRAFATALTAFATDEDTGERVVRAAVETFRTLRCWCEPGTAT